MIGSTPSTHPLSASLSSAFSMSALRAVEGESLSLVAILRQRVNWRYVTFIVVVVILFTVVFMMPSFAEKLGQDCCCFYGIAFVYLSCLDCHDRKSRHRCNFNCVRSFRRTISFASTAKGSSLDLVVTV